VRAAVTERTSAQALQRCPWRDGRSCGVGCVCCGDVDTQSWALTCAHVGGAKLIVNLTSPRPTRDRPRAALPREFGFRIPTGVSSGLRAPAPHPAPRPPGASVFCVEPGTLSRSAFCACHVRCLCGCRRVRTKHACYVYFSALLCVRWGTTRHWRCVSAVPRVSRPDGLSLMQWLRLMHPITMKGGRTCRLRTVGARRPAPPLRLAMARRRRRHRPNLHRHRRGVPCGACARCAARGS
jgi:hypothetical protein